MISDKLNKREREVLEAVLMLANGKERVLVSPEEVLAALPPKRQYDTEKLEQILKNLEMDGYFELVFSDRKGEKMYVFHIQTAGLNYKRTDYQLKRSVYFRWGVVAIGAVISAIIGIIIKAILS